MVPWGRSYREYTAMFSLTEHDLGCLYSDHLSREFHVEATEEMPRVAREIRVFPLLGLDGGRSAHLDHIVRVLSDRGYEARGGIIQSDRCE